LKTAPLKAEIIGFDSGWGASDYGCEDGAESIRTDKILLKLNQLGTEAKYRGTLGIKFLAKHEDIKSKEDSLPFLIDGLKRLFNHVKYSIENKQIPIVIGGDHSSAIGTWSGVTSATDSNSKFGLIWLDAHLDSHTYETSASGKWGGWWHGQPVSALIGEGLKEFTTIGGNRAKISPEHITIIGAHSFEPAENVFIKKHKIKVYYLNDVKKQGFKAVYEEALKRATTGTKGFGLTIDMDCFHPDYAPGVGTCEKQGLNPEDILPIIKSTAYNPMFKALEIVEFNPHNDEEHKTRDLIEKIIENIFTK